MYTRFAFGILVLVNALAGCSGSDSAATTDSADTPVAGQAASVDGGTGLQLISDAGLMDPVPDAIAPSGGQPMAQAEDAEVVQAPEPDAEPASVDMMLNDVDAGVQDDMAVTNMPDRDAALFEPVAVRITTAISQPMTRAGSQIRIRCNAFDANDNPLPDVRTRAEIRPRVGWSTSPDDALIKTGEQVGVYQVQCIASRLGLRDNVGQSWSVLPGPAAQTWASLTPPSITAGTSAQVTCRTRDSYGNPVPDARTTVAVAGIHAGLTVMDPGGDATIRAEQAKTYKVRCVSGGAATNETDLLVLPGLPSRLTATLAPADNVRIGTLVTALPNLTDAFNNRVPGAQFEFESCTVTGADIDCTTGLRPFGSGRYVANQPGRFIVRVSPPANDQGIGPIDLPLLVDDGPPKITCLAPTSDTAVLRGEDVTLRARVEDVAGLRSVVVNNRLVELDENSEFTTQVTATRGLNFSRIQAADEIGNQAQSYCPFFAADSYLDENSQLPDAITLDMGPTAVDDGPPGIPIASLTDIFRTVIEGSAITDLIGAAVTSDLLDFQGFSADFERVTISENEGGRTVSLGLTDDGLALNLRLEDVRLYLRIRGPLGIDTRGYIQVKFLQVQGRFDLRLVGGVPTAEFDDGALNIVRGPIAPKDFSGFSGLLLTTFYPLLEDTIETEVDNALNGLLSENVEGLLSSALGSLDLSAFSIGFEVAPLGGGDPVTIALSTNTTTVDVNALRLRFGLGTTIQGPRVNENPSPGVPVFGDARPIEQPLGGGNIGALIQTTMINQLMHGLWRAGFFNLSDIGALGAGADVAPDGLNFSFDLLVAPALENLDDGENIRIHFGPARSTLSYPGLLDEPIEVTLAATLLASVSVVDGELSFAQDGLTFERIVVVVENTALTPGQQEAVENDLGGIIRALAGDALNQAIPSLPVPAIELPAELGDLGIMLPPGTTLGLTNPRLEILDYHLFLIGELGQ